MTHPDAITFVGNIEILREQEYRTQEERKLDDTPEGSIVYPDLVFTLTQDPRKYYRPGVRQKEGNLVVVSNPLFFKAAKQAGIRRIRFDILPPVETSLGEDWMEKNRVDYPPETRVSNTINTFLFFYKKPRLVDLSGLNVSSFDKNKSGEYQNQNCLGYVVPATYRREESELVQRAVEANGSLRSINGIKNLGVHKKYFKRELPSSI